MAIIWNPYENLTTNNRDMDAMEQWYISRIEALKRRIAELENAACARESPTQTEDTRTGCLENVCWCHVDPQPLGFTCSSCGCVVTEKEEK